MKNYSVIFSIILLFLILLKNIIVDKAYKKNNRKKLLTTISFLAIVILLYIIWNCLTGSNVVSVKNEQDSSIKIFIYLLLGKDKGYRLKVLTKFIKKLFLGKFILKKISAFFVSLFLSSFLIIFTYHNKKTRKQNIVLAIGLLLGFIIYTLFLLFCYCVFFNKIEALNLSSFYRYLNSYLNALIMIDTIVIFNDNNKKSILLNNVYYYFLIILLFINPIGNGKKIFSRSYIKESYDLRMPYHEIANKFIDNIEENKNIYLLTQDYDKYSYHVFRYLLREKVKIIDAKYYSIVTKKEDIILSTNEKTNWDKMKVVSLEEIKKELFTDYDYLILYKYSDNFKNSYKELFENSNEIYSNSVYIVNKEKNKLQLKKR